jgi:hypothetical protein
VKPRARVVTVRPVDDQHQVLSVEGGDGYRRKPCVPCPWVVGNAEAFPAEAYRQSARTAVDAAPNMFGCHDSGPERPKVCAGFLLRGAEHNVGARLASAAGRIDPDEVHDDGRALYPSYRAMAIAGGVAPDDPALAQCRDPED